MKKKFVVALCLLMVAASVMFTACSGGGKTDVSDSKYVGEWKAVSFTFADESAEPDGDFFLTLNADGSAVISSDGETAEFTWKEMSGGGVELSSDSTAAMKLKDEGEDGLVFKVIGVEMHFERA